MLLLPLLQEDLVLHRPSSFSDRPSTPSRPPAIPPPSEEEEEEVILIPILIPILILITILIISIRHRHLLLQPFASVDLSSKST